MNVQGLNKVTLLDYPGKVACTVFTGGCDLRCPFCHNSALVERPGSPKYTADDILSFLSRRRGILDGVAVTGGEPLLHRDVGELFSKIKEMFGE